MGKIGLGRRNDLADCRDVMNEDNAGRSMIEGERRQDRFSNMCVCANIGFVVGVSAMEEVAIDAVTKVWVVFFIINVSALDPSRFLWSCQSASIFF